MGVLSGVNVLDLTYGSAGPIATQLLSDLGADVVRVDTSDDWPRRQQGALVRLRGRRSIFIDPDMPEAGEVVRKLIHWADVIVSEPGIDSPAPLAADYSALSQINERLISCRITGYGDEGPLADAPPHDHIVSARYGVYDQPGWREGPTFLTAPVASLSAALLAVQGIGSALYVREKTGRGQEVTTSLLAGALASQPGMISASVEIPMPDPGLWSRSPLGAAPFYSLYECADGEYLHFGCLTPAFQKLATEAIGLTEELTALGFGTPAGMANRPQIVAAITARMKERPYAEWSALFESRDIPHARAQWTEDLLDDPQVRDQGLVAKVEDPAVGTVEQMGQTIRFSDAPDEPLSPAPLPGQHTEDVCRDLGLADSEIERLRKSGAIR